MEIEEGDDVSFQRASANELLDGAIASARELLAYVDGMVLDDRTEEIGIVAAAERAELGFRLFEALTDFVERFDGKGKARGRGKGKAKGKVGKNR